MQKIRFSSSVPRKKITSGQLVVGFISGDIEHMRDDRTRVKITKSEAERLLDSHIAIPSLSDGYVLEIVILADRLTDFDYIAKQRVRKIAESNPHWNE